MTTDTAPRRRKWFRRKSVLIGMVLLVVLLGAGGLLLQRGAPTDAAELPPGWEVAVAEEGTIEATIDATGEVEPAAEAGLSFAVNGTVTAVLVKAGAFVEPGRPLARIDPVELELSLEKARADLAQEQADYATIREGATPQEAEAGTPGALSGVAGHPACRGTDANHLFRQSLSYQTFVLVYHTILSRGSSLMNRNR